MPGSCFLFLSGFISPSRAFVPFLHDTNSRLPPRLPSTRNDIRVLNSNSIHKIPTTETTFHEYPLKPRSPLDTGNVIVHCNWLRSTQVPGSQPHGPKHHD